MIYLRSGLYNLFFYAWSAVFLVLGLPLLALGGRTHIYTLGRIWVRVLFTALRLLCRITYHVEGRLPDRPYILASKHQSVWDTLFLALIGKKDSPAIVYKRELSWIPVFGWYLPKAGMLPIDRSGSAAALRRLLRSADGTRQKGRSIAVFPEGTRVLPSQEKPIQSGVAALYKYLSLPVFPMVLNSGTFWPRHAFCKKPGCIQVRILSPIAPGLSRRAFEERLRNALAVPQKTADPKEVALSSRSDVDEKNTRPENDTLTNDCADPAKHEKLAMRPSRQSRLPSALADNPNAKKSCTSARPPD